MKKIEKLNALLSPKSVLQEKINEIIDYINSEEDKKTGNRKSQLPHFDDLFYPEDCYLELIDYDESQAHISFGDNTILLNSDGTWTAMPPQE